MTDADSSWLLAAAPLDGTLDARTAFLSRALHTDPTQHAARAAEDHDVRLRRSKAFRFGNDQPKDVDDTRALPRHFITRKLRRPEPAVPTI
ncbi:hypothetical protein [Streptomyces solicathayae]|uniref:Uncharacterized protein n=1 Tax=Streptomyces solicathayae TaxID=3081768 RepID=A0ABZ0M5K8_9ACTN|nr:hypothetical protein [Streptomyces sp. HUAS YS2]WOX26368.1 hypothetical protein R2D22_35345 [Streptomyces sp. HUAS YS2]